ncbi:MAG: hypothetical protein V7608_2720 [Hyphomicrobiales bacterium]|jgi:hypothetical protein
MRKSRGSLIDLASESSAAAASTAMTLWHRLPMFGATSTAENRAEMTRMVDEKSAAFLDGCIAANMEMFRLFSGAAMGHFAPLFNAHVTIATAGLQPAFKTVNANARRLNRRATRG